MATCIDSNNTLCSSRCKVSFQYWHCIRHSVCVCYIRRTNKRAHISCRQMKQRANTRRGCGLCTFVHTDMYIRVVCFFSAAGLCLAQFLCAFVHVIRCVDVAAAFIRTRTTIDALSTLNRFYSEFMYANYIEFFDNILAVREWRCTGEILAHIEWYAFSYVCTQ